MFLNKIAILVLVWVPSGEAFSPASLRGEVASLSSSLRMDNGEINFGVNDWSSKEKSLLEVQESIAAAEARHRQLEASRLKLESELREAEATRTRLKMEVSQLQSTPEFNSASLATGLAAPLAAIAGARSFLSNRSQVQKQQAEKAAARAAAIHAARINTKKKSSFLPNPLAAIKTGAMGIDQKKSRGNPSMDSAKSFSFPDIKNNFSDIMNFSSKKKVSKLKSKNNNEKRDNQLRGAVATAAAAAWILGSTADKTSYMGSNINIDDVNTNMRSKAPTELIANNRDSFDKGNFEEKNAPLSAASVEATPPAASTVTLATNLPKSDPPKSEVNLPKAEEQLRAEQEILASIMAELDTTTKTVEEPVVTPTENVNTVNEDINFGATFAPTDESTSSLVTKMEPVDMPKAPVVESVAPVIASVEPTVTSPIVNAPVVESVAPVIASVEPTGTNPIETLTPTDKAPVAAVTQEAPMSPALEAKESTTSVLPGETVFPFAKTATPPLKKVTPSTPASTMMDKVIIPFASVATPPKMPTNEVIKTSASLPSFRAPDLVSAAKDVRSNFVKAFTPPVQNVVPEKKVTPPPLKQKEVHNAPLSKYAVPIGGAAALSFAAVSIAVGVGDEDDYEEYMSSEYEDYKEYMKTNQVNQPLVPATANGAGLRSYNSIPSNVMRAHIANGASGAGASYKSDQPSRANRAPVPNVPIPANSQVVENTAGLFSSNPENGRIASRGREFSYLESLPLDSAKTPTGQGNISYLDRL